MSIKVNWPASDGSTHEFTVFPPDTSWNVVGGIYIFSSALSATQWQAIYIGQTHSFQERLADHPQWRPAMRLGATHIHALVLGSEPDRIRLERLLIERCQPKLNQQFK